MKLYTSDGCTYSGMDEATVIRLRTELGRETTFVDAAAYDAIIQALQARP